MVLYIIKYNIAHISTLFWYDFITMDYRLNTIKTNNSECRDRTWSNNDLLDYLYHLVSIHVSTSVARIHCTSHGIRISVTCRSRLDPSSHSNWPHCISLSRDKLGSAHYEAIGSKTIPYTCVASVLHIWTSGRWPSPSFHPSWMLSWCPHPTFWWGSTPPFQRASPKTPAVTWCLCPS